MNRLTTITLLVLLTSSATAQTIPTEQEKTDALKKAFCLNGNSMVRVGSIDITDPAVRSVNCPIITKPIIRDTK